MEFLDQTELFKKYADEWVAMTDEGQVICSGSNPDNVLSEAKEKGYSEPIITKILNPDYDYLLV